MSDDTPTASAAPPQAARRRERPPKSPDAKQRGLAARKLQRQLEAVKATKDAKKLEEAAAVLARLNGEAPAAEQSPAAQAPAEATAAPPEMSAVPPTADASKPGWPSKAALADTAPTVRELVDVAAVFLAGTRFDLLAPLKVRVGEEVLERTKADVLAEKLTPLAAKYGVTLLDSPEAVAVAGLVTVFGQPLVQMALEKVAAGRELQPGTGRL